MLTFPVATLTIRVTL